MRPVVTDRCSVVGLCMSVGHDRSIQVPSGLWTRGTGAVYLLGARIPPPHWKRRALWEGGRYTSAYPDLLTVSILNLISQVQQRCVRDYQ